MREMDMRADITGQLRPRVLALDKWHCDLLQNGDEK